MFLLTPTLSMLRITSTFSSNSKQQCAWLSIIQKQAVATWNRALWQADIWKTAWVLLNMMTGYSITFTEQCITADAALWTRSVWVSTGTICGLNRKWFCLKAKTPNRPHGDLADHFATSDVTMREVGTKWWWKFWLYCPIVKFVLSFDLWFKVTAAKTCWNSCKTPLPLQNTSSCILNGVVNSLYACYRREYSLVRRRSEFVQTAIE